LKSPELNTTKGLNPLKSAEASKDPCIEEAPTTDATMQRVFAPEVSWRRVHSLYIDAGLITEVKLAPLKATVGEVINSFTYMATIVWQLNIKLILSINCLNSLCL